MAPSITELHDLPDPRPILPGIQVPLWFWLVVVVTVFAAATAAVFLLRRNRQPPGPPSSSTYGESRRALEQLRISSPERSLATVATDASLILRRYLATALEEPALYETHEEFALRQDALERLPAGARDRLAPLLEQLAEAKYGPSRPQPEAAAKLVDSCLEVLQGLESTRVRQVA